LFAEAQDPTGKLIKGSGFGFFCGHDRWPRRSSRRRLSVQFSRIRGSRAARAHYQQSSSDSRNPESTPESCIQFKVHCLALPFSSAGIFLGLKVRDPADPLPRFRRYRTAPIRIGSRVPSRRIYSFSYGMQVPLRTYLFESREQGTWAVIALQSICPASNSSRVYPPSSGTHHWRR